MYRAICTILKKSQHNRGRGGKVKNRMIKHVVPQRRGSYMGNSLDGIGV